ncbi:protein disulfide-isomerase TMX3 [Neocloeon triangulifer]|uniref:protein disulfide-isomerase TMX3 n=1 Tax=Neocloeon triangulifer TaxID=2078957 RepID=UPI00286EF0A5|nr:protein disulfide-isomerase TMX3 [Neocloeon triangulifer]
MTRSLHLLSLLFIFGLQHQGGASRVLELSDRFLDIRKDGQWLVKFYAPWCAHCKRLEPIWNHVAQTLHNTNIRVGKVDCTRFTAVATELKISGFPTIMFMKGEEVFTFRGDRTKQDIVDFALRVSGPPVQRITRPESIANLRKAISLFFVYIGPYEGVLWETYASIAETFQPHGYFYGVAPETAREHIDFKKVPAVLVYKDTMHFYYEEPPSKGETEEERLQIVNASLHHWVNAERFHTFPKITRGNIHQTLASNKNLVLAVVEENKLEDVPAHMIEFRDMIESVIRENKDRYHNHFQFGWTGSPDLANSVAMTVLPLPSLIVINATTNHHHLPTDQLLGPTGLTPETIIHFLDTILDESAPVYGGNSFFVKLYRAFFEGKTALYDMWMGNPVLTSVLFGLPLGFLSLICYSICCADIMDADEEEEEPDHEKKE